MRIKFLFFALAVLAGGRLCLAQTDAVPVARNAVFVELLGNGGLYSVNYERMVTDRVGLRLGYASWNSPLLFEGSPPDRYTTVPVTVSYLVGSGERKLELGGGVTFVRGAFDRFSSTRKDVSFQSLTAIVGYRSQPFGRGYLFRVGLTPFYSSYSPVEGEDVEPKRGFMFAAGVSFGYRF